MEDRHNIFIQICRRVWVSEECQDGIVFLSEEQIEEHFNLYNKRPCSGFFWLWMEFSKN